jgi:hypothetical protein
MGWSIEEFTSFCKRLKVDPKEALRSGYIDLRGKGHHGAANAKKGHEKDIPRSRLRSAVPQSDAPLALEPKARGKNQSALRADQRPRVRIEVRRAYLCDQDNLVGGTKVLIDCLRDVGLIKEDNPQAIDLEIHQLKVSCRQREGTIVTIDYP